MFDTVNLERSILSHRIRIAPLTMNNSFAHALNLHYLKQLFLKFTLTIITLIANDASTFTHTSLTPNVTIPSLP